MPPVVLLRCPALLLFSAEVDIPSLHYVCNDQHAVEKSKTKPLHQRASCRPTYKGCQRQSQL
jgi:hypothetical protein